MKPKSWQNKNKSKPLIKATLTRPKSLCNGPAPPGNGSITTTAYRRRCWRISMTAYLNHANRQIDQIRRRVLQGETIPHSEKVFSILQPHTEWISKGNAGVPVELGLRVCVVEDQDRFILHHQVMEKTTDDQIAVALVEQTQARFPALKAMSFDKGFHSPSNLIELKQHLDNVILPKKGRLSEADKARESDP